MRSILNLSQSWTCEFKNVQNQFNFKLNIFESCHKCWLYWAQRLEKRCFSSHLHWCIYKYQLLEKSSNTCPSSEYRGASIFITSDGCNILGTTGEHVHVRRLPNIECMIKINHYRLLKEKQKTNEIISNTNCWSKCPHPSSFKYLINLLEFIKVKKYISRNFKCTLLLTINLYPNDSVFSPVIPKQTAWQTTKLALKTFLGFGPSFQCLKKYWKKYW